MRWRAKQEWGKGVRETNQQTVINLKTMKNRIKGRKKAKAGSLKHNMTLRGENLQNETGSDWTMTVSTNEAFTSKSVVVQEQF